MNLEATELDKVLVARQLNEKEPNNLKRRMKKRRSMHLYISPAEMERKKSSEIQKRQEAAQNFSSKVRVKNAKRLYGRSRSRSKTIKSP